MVGCSIHFYRKILGVPFSVAQGTVNIGRARDEERAIEAAKRRFERRLGIEHWTIRADCFDVATRGLEILDSTGEVRPASTAL